MSLTNVHDALEQAVLNVNRERSEADDKNLDVTTIRVHPTVKEAAAQICAKHGVTISQFVRACLEGLVYDYVSEPPIEEEPRVGE